MCFCWIFYIDKKMEVTNKESASYVDLILTFEGLNAFFDGKEIDLTSLKKNINIKMNHSLVFDRSGDLSLAVNKTYLKNYLIFN